MNDDKFNMKIEKAEENRRKFQGSGARDIAENGATVSVRLAALQVLQKAIWNQLRVCDARHPLRGQRQL